jgi:hypothetical protein
MTSPRRAAEVLFPNQSRGLTDMADDNQQQNSPSTTGTTRDRARQSSAVAQAAGSEATRRSAEAGADVTAEAGHTVAEAVCRGGESVAETLRRSSENAQEIARHGALVGLEGGRRLMADSAEQVQELGRRTAEAFQEVTEGMRRMTTLPGTAMDGMRDMQQAVTGLMSGVARTNLRCAQELLRMVDPTATVALQQRYLREYLDVLMEGGTTIAGAARRTAQEALRPIEERIEARNGNGRKLADVTREGPPRSQVVAAE